MTDWEEDCKLYWGKLLEGKYSHWCPEFDDLPIDETCDEFEVCGCYEPTDDIRIIQNEIYERTFNTFPKIPF